MSSDAETSVDVYSEDNSFSSTESCEVKREDTCEGGRQKHAATQADKAVQAKKYARPPTAKVRSKTNHRGETRTVFNCSGRKSLASRRDSISTQEQSSLINSFSESFEQDLTLSDEPACISHSAISPRAVSRRLEPFRKPKNDAHRRIRPHVPLAKHTSMRAAVKAGTGRPPTRDGASNTRKLLSARKLRIDDLRNRVVDLERQLMEEEKEKRVLKNLYNRQQKELEKVEKSRMDLPEIEKAHDNETRALKSLMRKMQDKNKELESKLRCREDELQRRFNLCQNLKMSLQEKRRVEGESDKKVNSLKVKLKKQDDTIEKLKENISGLEKKLIDERMSHESSRNSLRTLKKKYEDMKKRSLRGSKQRNKSVQFCLEDLVSSSKAEGDSKEKPELQDRGTNTNDDKLLIEMIEKASNTETVLIEAERKSSLSSSKRAPGAFASPMKRLMEPLLNKELSDQPPRRSFYGDTRSSFRDRMCMSADSSRQRPQMRHFGMDIPLIIPMSSPKDSQTESDSSNCQLRTSDEFIQHPVHKPREVLWNCRFPEHVSQQSRQ